MRDLEVKLLEAFEDNYVFLILNPEKKEASAIDPGDGHIVDYFLSQHDYKLTRILCTHHHPDHVGGNVFLKEKYNCPVYANERDKNRIPGADHFVRPGEKLSFDGLNFQIIDCPGHTIGHIAFYEAKKNWLFCGDTIFSVGCGKMFEGNPEVFFETLENLKKLPEKTAIYCAHEYTLDNIDFAKSINKESKDLKDYEKICQKKRKEDIPTIPTTMKIEKKINPFFHCQNPEEFAEIRKKKDQF